MKIAVATACGALEAVGSEFAAAVGGVAAEAGGIGLRLWGVLVAIRVLGRRHVHGNQQEQEQDEQQGRRERE